MSYGLQAWNANNDLVLDSTKGGVGGTGGDVYQIKELLGTTTVQIAGTSVGNYGYAQVQTSAFGLSETPDDPLPPDVMIAVQPQTTPCSVFGMINGTGAIFWASSNVVLKLIAFRPSYEAISSTPTDWGMAVYEDDGTTLYYSSDWLAGRARAVFNGPSAAPYSEVGANFYVVPQIFITLVTGLFFPNIGDIYGLVTTFASSNTVSVDIDRIFGGRSILYGDNGEPTEPEGVYYSATNYPNIIILDAQGV